MGSPRAHYLATGPKSAPEELRFPLRPPNGRSLDLLTLIQQQPSFEVGKQGKHLKSKDASVWGRWLSAVPVQPQGFRCSGWWGASYLAVGLTYAPPDSVALCPTQHTYRDTSWCHCQAVNERLWAHSSWTSPQEGRLLCSLAIRLALWGFRQAAGSVLTGLIALWENI